MVVSAAKCSNIAPPHLTNIGQISPSPAKRLAIEPFYQKIRHQSRMAPIAVRKGMYRNQAMVKPKGDFIGWVDRVRDPVADIIQKIPQLYSDAISFNADVALGPPKRAGPRPYIT